ncbi:tudor domain-containing protein 15 [Caerostris extrusa]|uniref:Tudor domain-containing protein 15 n=1 Tax=Caerostris extrusa TaxID=172846 RepID=A0AAV4WSM4_CAEEX|nr:tudor domain-containing protein 15 [Caerostris extrusa]
MDEIKLYTSSANLIPLNSPQLNTPCLAQFSDKQLFYRGIITAIKQNRYSVHFVDYGYSELKDHNELRVIPNRFLALPTQAICICTLPQGDVNVEEFGKIINCKLVECHVLGHNRDAYIVKLAPYSQESIVQRSSPPVSKSQMWTYQHQKLNLNTTHDVTVSYNNGVSEFYCQLNVHKKQLDDISDVLNSGIEMEPLSLADCVPNLPVCVKFSEDNVWYRAQIIKINHEHDIEVFLWTMAIMTMHL